MRLNIHDIDNGRFLQVQRSLFTGKYKDLSNDARLVYALIKERLCLSLKNKWIEENGDVYCYYPQENIGEFLGMSKSTVIRVFKQLKDVGLLDSVKQGLGQPAKLYLNKVTEEKEVILQECQIDTSEVSKTITRVSEENSLKCQIDNSECQNDKTEVSDWHSNYTDINNTKYKYTDKSNTEYINNNARARASVGEPADVSCSVVELPGKDELSVSGESRGAQQSRFDWFWQAYPRKVGKGAAEKAWKKIRPSGELTSRIVDAVDVAKQSAQWQKEGGQYIPNPATWLNQKRWEDELQPAVLAAAANNPQAEMARRAMEMIENGF